MKSSTFKIGFIFKTEQTRIILFFVVVLLCSCNGRKKREETTKVLLEWIEKEILFPENITCYISGKEALRGFCDECIQKEYKILLYVDSTGCSDCQLNLFEWNNIIEEADSLFQERLGFVFYFQPKNVRDMTNLFFTKRFEYPVIMDINGEINRRNNFPKMMEHQCFLLGNDNKVLAIGNPALSHRIWVLYKSIIIDNVTYKE